MAKDKIPTSRVGRTARIGGLAAGQAIRQAGTRAVNVTRNEEGRKVALEKRQLEAAEQIVAALGTMKGAAMKLGQVLSFLDVGLVPEEYRDEFQRKLAALRDAAPNVAFKDMRKVIEEELEEPLKAEFAEFDEEPVAAASIGQVYRARLHDGRDVAVKVQYPGVAAAVRSDMQNLGLILRLAKRIAPGLDPAAIGREISERIHDELDRRHVGLDESRRHRGHRDPPPAQSSRERLPERDQARLARAIGWVVGLAAEGAARRDVDDPPTGAHVAQNTPGDVGRSHEVDAQRVAPGLLPLLVGGVVRRVRLKHAGVVDEDVDAAERAGHLVDHAPDGLGVGQVGAGDHVPAAG